MNKANANQFQSRKGIALRLMFCFVVVFISFSNFIIVFDSADLVSPRISLLCVCVAAGILFFFLFGAFVKATVDYDKSAFKRRAYSPSAQVNTIQINVYS